MNRHVRALLVALALLMILTGLLWTWSKYNNPCQRSRVPRAIVCARGYELR
jgi:hypothetical protein